ncbi:hypothetical protein J2W22_000248 [Sphingomonas kyeonggiensis]|uniref:hypothetical protein n=1 Tax=Sphingomonas kyeonggiensis TaxID=1268553 RepID=UPI00277F2D2C|nr:hypothetical protein [Sphingomonas kyeonggiensis]MDQ0248201.1 hypothetical protein [Sphingomonas kyeonggiensis]
MTTPRHLKQVLKLLSNYDGPPPADLPEWTRHHYERMRRIVASPDLVGLGIAQKEIGGTKVDELALIFYVRHKEDGSRIAPEMAIPPVIAAPNGKAIYTDVVEIGEVVPQATRSPIASGHSVGGAGQAGTLGAIVSKNGKAAILSNSHVLAAAGTAAFGDPILYPAAPDGGIDPADRIALLSAFRPFKTGGQYVNRVDAALAELLPAALNRISRVIPNAASPLDIADPVRGMTVTLTGRSSGSVGSTIDDADATLRVPYPGPGLVGFEKQCLCKPAYTREGDSGALVLDSNNGKIVGLHFAASTLGSYFTPIRAVMSALGFSL